MWVLALFNGGLFGLWTGVFSWLQHGSLVNAVVGGIVGGTILGAIMAPFTVRQRDSALAAAGPLPADRQRDLQRQLLTGRVPSDPEGREVAQRVLRHRQAELRRWRPLGIVMFSVMLVLTAVFALTEAAWWWLLAVFWIDLLLQQFLAPRRLERRLARLES
jgi:hypothetical protein